MIYLELMQEYGTVSITARNPTAKQSAESSVSKLASKIGRDSNLDGVIPAISKGNITLINRDINIDRQ